MVHYIHSQLCANHKPKVCYWNDNSVLDTWNFGVNWLHGRWYEGLREAISCSVSVRHDAFDLQPENYQAPSCRFYSLAFLPSLIKDCMMVFISCYG